MNGSVFLYLYNVNDNKYENYSVYSDQYINFYLFTLMKIQVRPIFLLAFLMLFQVLSKDHILAYIIFHSDCDTIVYNIMDILVYAISI